MVPTSALAGILDHVAHRFGDSGWAPLFALAILVAYALAGTAAGALAPGAPLGNGAVAALVALGAWLPVRVVIWALHHGGHGLVTGHRPVLAGGQVFLQAVLAVALGALGGQLGARGARGARMVAVASRPGGRVRAADPSEERPDSTGQGAG